jgi:hypothetical protein
LQFQFGVPFKHLKLTTTNRFGEFVTDKDMTGATQACKDAYKAWCQAKGIVYKDPEKYAAEKSLATAIASASRGGKRSFKGQGNGFKSRAGRGRTGQQSGKSFNTNRNNQK